MLWACRLDGVVLSELLNISMEILVGILIYSMEGS